LIIFTPRGNARGFVLKLDIDVQFAVRQDANNISAVDKISEFG